MAVVTVTRTYLQVTGPDQVRGAPLDRSVTLERGDLCSPSFYRRLYADVGRDYHWRDRMNWTDEEIASYLAQPDVTLWIARVNGEVAGYFELRADPDHSTEIVYFGLLPPFTGKGLGKQLLTAAASRAWAGGATRVWLHTCTLDNPAALPNYTARGFMPFRREQYEVTLPD
ncbi:MAG: GNAT family N-acetyltransferase [Gemmatimonadaceae bacterium]